MSRPPSVRPPLPDGSRNANPQDIGFFALIIEDFGIHGHDLFSQGFWALFWHRFGNWRMGIRPKLLRAPMTALYRAMAKLSEVLGGVMLPYTVQVGRRLKIEHFGGIVISARRIGDDVILRQNTTFGIASVNDVTARPIIGDRVDIGVGVVIIGDVTVGDDSVIGANAVVTRDVPPGSVAVGVPARCHPRKPHAD